MRKAIDLENESALAINETPAYVQRLTGRRPGLSTCWRWVLRGSGGTKLDSFLLGGRRYTTKEAVARFFARESRSDPAPVRTPKQRERAISAAERELAEAGI
ncbi:MAG: DUF1580 domain-containing protein [Planctomycetes bacterium]|nr:DUF1580 domain-containing protein [Planctomycetota bacterium]